MRHRYTAHRRSLIGQQLERRELLAADGLFGPLVTVFNRDATSRPAIVKPTLPPVLVRGSATGQLEAASSDSRQEARPAEDARQLAVETPRTFVPGVPFLVRVSAELADGTIDRALWNADVSLQSDNPDVTLSTESDAVKLVNGLGSLLVTIETPQPFGLVATLDDLTVTVPIEPISLDDAQTVSGPLTGEASVWSGVVHVTGDVVVPDGHELTIEEGTMILVDGLRQSSVERIAPSIRVDGTLRALGTDHAPIHITAHDATRPWGELHVRGGVAELDHVMLTRAGNSRRGGHTNTGPALRMTANGSLSLLNSSVTDISGKILQSDSGALEIRHTLLSRAVMGPEINDTSLRFQSSWVIDMAGRFHYDQKVDDNDGIYLHRQQAGQQIELIDSVVSQVQDDGIDTLRSDVLARDMIVRDIVDKAISVFSGTTTVERSLLVNADIGIDSKGSGTSTTTTNVRNTTIANVNLAIRARDNDAPNATIHYDVSNSILHVRAGGDPIVTHYDPSLLRVNYTWAAEPWTTEGSGEGNLVGMPEFRDLAAHDYRLPEGSPAIDAGDPDGPLDPDGTRADLGFAPRFQSDSGMLGDFDQDGDRDQNDLDLICQIVRDEGPYQSQMDVNRDGVVTNVDMLVAVTSPDGFDTVRGDANLDGVFDTEDLVSIFQVGLYEDGVAGNGSWATGDWNCDGDFTSADLVAAFQDGGYVG